MGLDMYLSVRKYISRVDFSQPYDEAKGWEHSPDFTSLVESVGAEEFIEPQDSAGAHIEIPVAYWRKANAIHKWFVDERADGVDQCQPIGVHVDHLKELLELCNEVLENRDKAEELLPTESGFFFGNTEYDEYYFQDLEYTQRRLSELVPLMERKNDKGHQDNDWAVYQASW
jgi:hypothetical protein